MTGAVTPIFKSKHDLLHQHQLVRTEKHTMVVAGSVPAVTEKKKKKGRMHLSLGLTKQPELHKSSRVPPLTD